MVPNKACPVVIREKDGETQILVFTHPRGGDVQLVKGTIEPGEDPAAAALRELAEESGIDSKIVLCDLGLWETGYEDQIWSIHLCAAVDLPDEWSFFTADDGGVDYKFFWHTLGAEPAGTWHPVYLSAAQYIQNVLRKDTEVG